jgi:tetratricopeptide (TPR) repeat protein
LAENLFIPVDAELVPALLDDEAEGLTKDRGLVFLPDGRVVAFDPNATVDLSQLLLAPPRTQRTWQPFPEHEGLAERLDAIVVELPGEAIGPAEPNPDAADSLLDAGNADIGVEPPRPEDAGAASTMLGRAALGAGRSAMALGRALGLPGLARAGAEWVRRALELAPRLGESVFGSQQAALRALLKEFLEGDPERALRHALPLEEPGSTRGAVPDTGANLPTHNLRYSLDDLLVRNDRGQARLWVSEPNVMAELARAYRRAAEQALARGDHRRAAFIFGKLLRDYRTAAGALLRGSLYRDAAAIFLARLGDTRAAALALESAGDIDRAVELYRRSGDHVAAGDLLRRVGDDHAAITEYQLAAERLAASSAGPLAAGELLLAKMGRTDLALGYFQSGWELRPQGNAVPCAIRLAKIFVDEGQLDRLNALLDEADAFFEPEGHDQSAGHFYDEVVQLAESPRMGAAHEDLRDRALMLLAAKLRQNTRMASRLADPLATLFPSPKLWPQSMVRDAEFALAAVARRTTAPGSGLPANMVHVGSGTVTAACAAVSSGEIFLGFDGGDVYCFRPATSEIVLVGANDLPVASLAVDEHGRSLVIVRAGASDFGSTSTYERRQDGSYRLLYRGTLEGLAEPWLTPVFRCSNGDLVGLWDGERLSVMEVATLTPRGEPFEPEEIEPRFALIVPWHGASYALIVLDRSSWWLVDPHGTVVPLGFGGKVAAPPAGLRQLMVSELWSDHVRLESAWLVENGTLFWAAFDTSGPRVSPVASGSSGERGGYRAGAVIRPGLVAGISATRLDWYRGRANSLRHVNSASGFEGVVAAYPCRRTNELMLIRSDGMVRRTPAMR